MNWTFPSCCLTRSAALDFRFTLSVLPLCLLLIAEPTSKGLSACLNWHDFFVSDWERKCSCSCLKNFCIEKFDWLCSDLQNSASKNAIMQLKNVCWPFVSWIDVRVRKNCLFFSFAIYTIKVSISSLAIIFRALGTVHLITWYANYCHYPFCFLLFMVGFYSSKDRDDKNITIQKEQHSRSGRKNDHTERFVRYKVLKHCFTIHQITTCHDFWESDWAGYAQIMAIY